MLFEKSLKPIFKALFIVALIATALAVNVTPAAAFSDSFLEPGCTFGHQGEFSGSQGSARCVDAIDPQILATYCSGETYFSIETLYLQAPIGWTWDHSTITCYNAPAAPAAPAPDYGMRRKGLCKLIDIEDASLGGTITATVKGNPSVLKLKADGKTYSLPVVPGSVVANGDGTYTAQFYTMDPETGQALVPAGDYSARCHGWGGSNDGSRNTVSIGY